MEKYTDLHTHSTASDGTFTPERLAEAAKEAGLASIALTDHDTVCPPGDLSNGIDAHA